ncbi:hypothetical protein HF325_001664 [Metschnikowia pulcherrima]|uniref:DUF4112 domain-containing protein n=1 Tax=Metschnikowia pulcherrima TaxID=27326 RepID=A0A8H7GX43_9ASCO|nr:hypothetical protein HF325_001664 [Metschnikowia pulcherrima]
MSSLFYQYFLKKTNLDSVVKVGGVEDPYFETIPDEDLHFYQRKGAKRKRRLPGFIAENDLKVLNSVKRKAYRLDLQLSLCGLRLGWAGIIGLLPWIGDIIAGCLALQLVRKAEQIEGGLPVALRLKMMANVAFDFGIGLIPIVGDLINIAYKCNLRNFVMLEKYLVEKYHKNGQKMGVPAYTDASEVSVSPQGNVVSKQQTTGVYGDPKNVV